jgi:hypothetical protein
LGIEHALKHMNRDAELMKTIEARVVKNIKEEPSNQSCDVWNIEASVPDKIPEDAQRIMADFGELQVDQIEAARTDPTRTCVTIRTQRKSTLEPGDLIHLQLDL